MNGAMVRFVAKVFILSTLIGVVIKYGSPLLEPTPSLGLCLIFLLAPSVLMVVLFLRQVS
jgi:uncharacterized membrane protein YccC